MITPEELANLQSQIPGLPVGWRCPVADLIDEVSRLQAEREQQQAHSEDLLADANSDAVKWRREREQARNVARELADAALAGDIDRVFALLAANEWLKEREGP